LNTVLDFAILQALAFLHLALEGGQIWLLTYLLARRALCQRVGGIKPLGCLTALLSQFRSLFLDSLLHFLW
jgi:hypothetical protein